MLRTFDLQQQPNHFAIKIIDMADGSDVHLRLFDADDDAPFFRVRNSYERTDGAGAFVVFDCSQPNEFETHVRCGNIA